MSDTTATNKEIFDAGIEMTKKAADRLAAVMEGEGKKGFGLRKITGSDLKANKRDKNNCG